METVVLRQWIDADVEPFAVLNANPLAMQYFPAPLTREETAAMVTRLRSGIAERGWGLWAVEVNDAFAGMCGLSAPRFTAPFTPCVEVGWRFLPEFWGRGLAFRAAAQALQFGFEHLQLAEVVSFTAVPNAPSRRLMERLGFTRDVGGDFDHPMIAVAHPLARHVLYRLERGAWPDSAAARSLHAR
jgi:RimJ/RimL family protein N-acetyltransferase